MRILESVVDPIAVEIRDPALLGPLLQVTRELGTLLRAQLGVRSLRRILVVPIGQGRGDLLVPLDGFVVADAVVRRALLIPADEIVVLGSLLWVAENVVENVHRRLL